MSDEGDFLSAVRDGDAATVRQSLEEDPSLATLKFDDGASTLGMAARLGRLDVLRCLLEFGGDSILREEKGEEEGRAPTALMEGAASGEGEAVAILLEHGADPAVRDDEGRTAADYARDNGHPELARRLQADAEAERTAR